MAERTKRPQMNLASHSMGDTVPFSLTDKERRLIALLVVESDVSMRNSIRQALVALGYEDISDASDHNSAMQRMEDKTFSHLIFDTRSTKVPIRQFLSTILEKQPNIIALPSSYEPTVDDVFNLLIGGARGYIVKPFTAGSLDEAIVWATKGDPISESILYCKDRNEALASLIFATLDKLAHVLKQSNKFETAKRELPSRINNFHRSLDLGHTFAKGGDPQLRRAIIDLAIERADEPYQPVGTVQTRARRKSQRAKAEPQPTPQPRVE